MARVVTIQVVRKVYIDDETWNEYRDDMMQETGEAPSKRDIASAVLFDTDLYDEKTTDHIWTCYDELEDYDIEHPCEACGEDKDEPNHECEDRLRHLVE